MPSLCANDERLSSEGVPVPHHLLAKDPQAHLMSPQEYVNKVQEKQNTTNEQSPCHGRTGIQDESTTAEPTTRDNAARIQGLSEATPSPSPGPAKTETIDTGAQTDDTEHFYVSKDNILAYTIAVVQNT